MTSSQETIRAVAREMTQPTRRRARRSVSQIAVALDVSPIAVYKWGEGDGGNDIPAHQIAPLCRATDDRLLLEHIARACDCIVVPVPKSKRADAAKAIQQFGEFLAEYGKVTRDDEVSDSEGKSLQREADETIQAILYVVAQAKVARVKQAKPSNVRPMQGAM